MEWQPIETAPKDGTEVLVWSKELEGMAVAKWDGMDWLMCGEYSAWPDFWMTCHRRRARPNTQVQP